MTMVYVAIFVTEADISAQTEDSKWREWYETLTAPNGAIHATLDGATRAVLAAYDEALQSLLDADNGDLCTYTPEETGRTKMDWDAMLDKTVHLSTTLNWEWRWETSTSFAMVDDTFAYARIYEVELGD